MKRLTILMLTALAAGASLFEGRAEETPRFKEVYDLVLEHLSEVNAAQLEQAAVEGLLEKLHPRVVLLGSEPAGEGEVKAESVAWTKVYDKAFGYVRIRRINSGLAKALAEAVEEVASSNELKGLVLDLRYASGDDYAAAAAAADLFFSVERPLIDYGDGLKRSTAKENAVKLPVAVLVNGETAAAAEALAGVLRQSGLGLLLGERSAGHASLFREFQLETGQTLRMATSAITVGDGTPLAGGGVTPDIEVVLGEAEGRAYYEDAYALPPGETSARRRPRMNEAELVRLAREGADVQGDLEHDRREGADPLEQRRLIAPDRGGEAVSAPPVMRDPVLGRAIDLLKGISVVKRYRSL